MIPRLVLACACGLSLGVAQPTQQAILVSAAVSLTEVMEDIASRYRASGGGEVRFNFAASNTLARQISNGAPADVFISADEAQMDAIERAGLVVPGTRAAIVSNRLAIVVPAVSRTAIASAAALAEPAIRRIAIGDPAGVPAGVYARRYLQRVGLWESLQSKMVPLGSVRAALSAAATGAVDAAIVYVTDARGSNAVRLAAVIDSPDAPAIAYPACVVRGSRRVEAARAFVAFLHGEEARQAFARAGFIPFSGDR